MIMVVMLYANSINNRTCINIMMLNRTTITIIIPRMIVLIMTMTIMIMTIITIIPTRTVTYRGIILTMVMYTCIKYIYIYMIDWLHHGTYDCTFILKLWCSHLRHGCICSRFSTLPTSWSSFQLKAWDMMTLNFVWLQIGSVWEARSSAWSTASGARPVQWWTFGSPGFLIRLDWQDCLGFIYATLKSMFFLTDNDHSSPLLDHGSASSEWCCFASLLNGWALENLHCGNCAKHWTSN